MREFQLTSYQIGEVFDRFFDLNIDPDNYDLRQATCDWFIDNFEEMTKFIPEGFPRTIQSESEQPFQDGDPIEMESNMEEDTSGGVREEQETKEERRARKKAKKAKKEAKKKAKKEKKKSKGGD